MISHFWICSIHRMHRIWVNYRHSGCAVSSFVSSQNYFLPSQLNENAIILIRLLLVISNILREVCGTAKNSRYQSEPDRLYSSISLNFHRRIQDVYVTKMHSLVLLQPGERCFAGL